MTRPADSEIQSEAGDSGLERRQRRSESLAASGAPPVDDGDADFEQIDEEDLARARADRARARQEPSKSTARNLAEWLAVVVGAVLIAVVIRTFVFQTFWIPSPSMASTLVKDDRVLVNKLSYRFHDVNRGDVVVFERPDSLAPSAIKDLIKRVVGLPGDQVSIIDGEVRIDGQVLEEPYTDGQPTEPMVGCGTGETAGIETPEGLAIPEGMVLVLGDNRTNSDDGRCFGPIDEDLIVGRAFLIMWPPSKMGGL